MIQAILDDITSKIGYFDMIPLAQVIEGKTMLYKGRSEYEVINIEKGGGYYELTSMDQDREEGLTCEEDIIRDYTLELSVNIKRKDLDCDDQYSFDRVANDIISKISGQNRPLARTLGIRYIDVFVDDVSADGSFMSKHYLYIRMKLKIETKFAASCLTLLC